MKGHCPQLARWKQESKYILSRNCILAREAILNAAQSTVIVVTDISKIML